MENVHIMFLMVIYELKRHECNGFHTLAISTPTYLRETTELGSYRIDCQLSTKHYLLAHINFKTLEYMYGGYETSSTILIVSYKLDTYANCQEFN